MEKFWVVIGLILTIVLGGIITTFAIGEKHHQEDVATFSQKQEFWKKHNKIDKDKRAEPMTPEQLKYYYYGDGYYFID